MFTPSFFRRIAKALRLPVVFKVKKKVVNLTEKWYNVHRELLLGIVFAKLIIPQEVLLLTTFSRFLHRTHVK